MTTTNNPLNQLAAAELTAAAAPIITALTNIKNGDGTTVSVIGQGVVLQAQVLAILPTLQKIGITDIAGFLLDKVNAAVTNATTPPPVDNAHVAEATTQFTAAEVAANGNTETKA